MLNRACELCLWRVEAEQGDTPTEWLRFRERNEAILESTISPLPVSFSNHGATPHSESIASKSDMPLDISKYIWPTDTRQCDFCLCLQGGSVFADFNIASDGRVYLMRISYDGYGCCNTDGNATKLPLEESQTLLKLIDADGVNRDEVREILYHYFDQNKDVLWRDALEEHKLLVPRMQTKLLNESQFHTTFAAPMRDVTGEATNVTDIWPYVDSVPPKELRGHEACDQFVEFVFRDATGRFDHVQVMTKTKNVYLIIVVDLRDNMIYGHHLLDLNEKYGLTGGMPGDSSR